MKVGIGPVIYREYRFRITNITFLVWDVLVPVSYLLIFGYGFQRSLGNAFSTPGYNTGYASFFLAGILSMTCFNIAMNTSWRFFTERENGIFYELLTYPISRRNLVAGKILFNVGLGLAGCFLCILLGVWVLNIRIAAHLLAITAAGVAIGTAGWFFFFTILALWTDRADAYNTVTSICYIVMMFASSLFYPLENLPSWFRAVSRLNPMTWQTDVLRYSTLGVASDPLLLVWESAAFLLFLIVSFAGAVRAVNRAAE